MARTNRLETVFFRYDGDTRKDVYLRIAPTAIRWQQGSKGGATDTLGGYFQEIMYSTDPQYRGVTLPDLTIEGTTGIAYRKELDTLKWIWEHRGDRKADHSPVDIYFYDLIPFNPFQKVERGGDRIWLISMQNFAYDETVQAPYEVRFTMRCKILRNMLSELQPDPPQTFGSVPDVGELVAEEQTADLSLPETSNVPDLANVSFGTATVQNLQG